MNRTTITIREDQAKWIKDNHFTLSPFIQEKLDELITEQAYLQGMKEGFNR